MTRIKNIIKNQFNNPSGLLGHVAGWVMANQSHARIHWAVSMLDIQPDDHVLEIGCGPGLAAEMIIPKLSEGKLTAIDQSPVMITMAKKRCESYHNKNLFFGFGQLKELQTLLQKLKLPLPVYNKIFAFNVDLFCHDPITELHTIKNFLGTGGFLYIFHKPLITAGKQASLKFVERVTPILARGHFEVIKTSIHDFVPVPAVCIISKSIA